MIPRLSAIDLRRQEGLVRLRIADAMALLRFTRLCFTLVCLLAVHASLRLLSCWGGGSIKMKVVNDIHIGTFGLSFK